MPDFQNNVAKVIKSYYTNEDVNVYLNKPYVELLPEYLLKGEIVEAFLFGKQPAIGGSASGGLWATNKRILYISKWFSVKTFRDFSYGKIEGISYSFGTIRLQTAGFRGFYMQFVDAKAAMKFISHVRSKIDNFNNNKDVEENNKSEDPGFIDQLEKLGILKEKGIINDAEFLIAKKKLLGE